MEFFTLTYLYHINTSVAHYREKLTVGVFNKILT